MAQELKIAVCTETPLFNACLYRFRYAYDYVMLYDWYVTHSNALNKKGYSWLKIELRYYNDVV